MPNPGRKPGPFHFSTKRFKFGQCPANQTFNWFVVASAAGPADEQAFVSEAIYAVAVRPRFSSPFGRLRNFVGGGRVRLPLFQPELEKKTAAGPRPHKSL